MKFLTILTVLFLAFSMPVSADNYDVDKSHSATAFKVKHMGVAYTHGRFNEFKGSFSFDKNNDSKNNIKLFIQASSIDSNDPKRDDHLKGEDFFHAKKYKTLSFESSSFKKASGNKYKVTGTLKIHGKAKEITVDVTYIGEGKDPWGNYRCGFETQFTIKRSDFGMNYMQGEDKIGDEVTITIGIEGTRK